MTNAKEKKPTRAQIESKVKNALVFVPRDKEYKEIYFSDRGLRLAITSDYAIVGRLSFQFVFNRVVPNGYSVNYIIIEKIIEMAEEYGCITKNDEGEEIYSYWTLFDNISTSGKEGATIDLSIFCMFSIWINTQQHTLFGMSDNMRDSFTLQAIHDVNTLIYGVMSKPYEKDMSNKDLFVELQSALIEYIADIKDEYEVLKKETEEEKQLALADALSKGEDEKFVKEQVVEEIKKENESQD